MNAKKWVTIVTLICTIIAVVLMTVFKCCFSDGNIGYDIALAIFGSALLGLIMSLVEYFSERKKAMEQFWIEAKRVLAQFRKAKYIYFDEPEEIVIGCINELLVFFSLLSPIGYKYRKKKCGKRYNKS